MYCAHSLINIATCHGMSNLGFSSSSGTTIMARMFILNFSTQHGNTSDRLQYKQ